MKKELVIAGSAIAGLLVVLILGSVLFLDPNQYRPQLEQAIGQALGRKVTIGAIRVAPLSGGVDVRDLAIADDPRFGPAPFVTARAVTVGVDLMPLIVSRSLRVHTLRLQDPQIVLLRSTSGQWNFSGLGGALTTPPSAKTSAAIGLSVQKITIANGRILVARGGGGGQERVYTNVNLEISNLSLTSQFPFRMTADTPGGGTVALDGRAGPIDASDAANTRFSATAEIAHMDLKSTGFIDPVAGLSGVVDFTGSFASDGQRITSKGKLRAIGVQLVAGGGPARRPIEIDYESEYNRKAQTGIVKGDARIGKAVADLIGDYNAAGDAISVRMKLSGQHMPVTDLEATLPAVGVELPSGVSLTQGTMDVNLTIDGPVDRVVIAGPINLSNALIAGFDLGSKLSTLESLGGLSRVPPNGDTVIQSFAASVRVASEGIQVTSMNLTAKGIGSFAGSGAISGKGDLNLSMRATLSDSSAVAEVLRIASLHQPASGIPFRVTGTTSNPVFVPDVGGTVRGLLGSPGAANGMAGALGGLLGLTKR